MTAYSASSSHGWFTADAVTKYSYYGDDILYEQDSSNALKALHTHGHKTF